jgi:sulfotransferase
MHTMHFISGLPRSGSSLLASILRQNPDFYASIMSPVGKIVTEAVTSMGPDNEAEGFIDDAQRDRILRLIFMGFYADCAADVVFDNNRRWTANAALLRQVFPGAKIICCMRHPAAVVDSFERLFRSHPLSLSKIYGARANLTVYDRTSAIISSDGVLGFALNAFRDAFFGPDKDALVIVNYDDLCRFPERVLADIHLAIDLKPFAYDFTKIEPIPGAAEFDKRVATPGLHDLKPRIVYEKRNSILPPDLYAKLPKPFWYPTSSVNETATKVA